MQLVSHQPASCRKAGKIGVSAAAWRIFLLLVKIALPPLTSNPDGPKHHSCIAFIPWNSNFFFSRTTVTVQISTRASRYCKYLYLLSGYRSSEQQRCGHLNFGNYYFSNLTRLDERGETVFTYTRTMKSYLGIHFINVFYLHFSIFKAVLIVQLTFIDFNY
jgi:hypothetical protein